MTQFLSYDSNESEDFVQTRLFLMLCNPIVGCQLKLGMQPNQ